MKTLQDLLDGKAELNRGLFLQSGSELRAEQSSWDEGDSCKEFEFSAEWYITNDSGESPEAVYYDEDLSCICQEVDDDLSDCIEE